MAIILDISKWQQEPDFAKLGELYKNGTIAGVIIRVQHGYTNPDEKYKQYVASCKQYGIPFGTYAYAAPVSTNDAIAEANSSFNLTDKESKCFAVDIEEKDCADIVAAGQAYIDRLHALGMKNVGKYSYTGFYNNNNLAAIKADWTWIASYGVDDGKQHDIPNVEGMDLWQFTSTGHVDGISTNVDESVVTDSTGFPFFNKPVVAPIYRPIIAQVKVIVKALNVRQGPGPQYPIISVVYKDKILNVTGNLNDWHEVILDSKTKGYAYGNNGTYLELIR